MTVNTFPFDPGDFKVLSCRPIHRPYWNEVVGVLDKINPVKTRSLVAESGQVLGVVGVVPKGVAAEAWAFFSDDISRRYYVGLVRAVRALLQEDGRAIVAKVNAADPAAARFARACGFKATPGGYWIAAVQ